MIEKLDIKSLMSSSPRAMAVKINELIEASNRQDLAIAILLGRHRECMHHLQDVNSEAAAYYIEVIRG